MKTNKNFKKLKIINAISWIPMWLEIGLKKLRPEDLQDPIYKNNVWSRCLKINGIFHIA